MLRYTVKTVDPLWPEEESPYTNIKVWAKTPLEAAQKASEQLSWDEGLPIWFVVWLNGKKVVTFKVWNEPQPHYLFEKVET